MRFLGHDFTVREILFTIAVIFALLIVLIFWKEWPVTPTPKTFPELVGLSLFFAWLGETQ